MLRGECFQLRDERQLTTECELRVDAFLDRGEPQLLEALDLHTRERLELEVGQGPSLPQVHRRTQRLGRRDRVAGRKRFPAGGDEAFEPFQVELAGLDAKQVAGRTRDESWLAAGSRRQHLAQARDVIA
jgi:hypothetical protein